MEKKEAYQKKMEAQLHEWQAKIDVLKAKAAQAQADRQIQYHEEIESLQQKQKHVREKLNELKSAGTEVWEDIRDALETAWIDLKASFDRALVRFR
ncbi:MAG: coiled coil domain-containing protein [Desulfobulbaceae bacterium]|nr:coiled coil domain-containing protein [Desulfobulbaceae bacterium]